MRVTPNCDSIRSFYIYTDTRTPAQYAPEITFGGGNYLVVWGDGRSTNFPVYASRVTPSGTVLDPTGILVSRSTTATQYFPAVAWGGTRYFVVWGYYSPAPYAVYGRFVNTNGTMASDTIRLGTGTTGIYHTGLAYDGTNYLVIWVEYATSSVLKGQMVSGSGALIGSPFTIASPVMYFKSASVCFDGTNYLVAYALQTGGVYKIWGRKYNRSGAPVGSAFAVSNSTYSQSYNSVVPGANNRYLNVWSEYRSTYDIYGNIDVMMTEVEEQTTGHSAALRLKSSIVRDMIRLEGGREFLVFDVSGREVGKTTTGAFDCRRLESGVYFVRVPSGERLKVVKVR